MVDRMSERAKDDLNRVLEKLYALSPEVDKLSTECANALQANIDAGGDYISQRTIQAFSEIREALAHLLLGAKSWRSETASLEGRLHGLSPVECQLADTFAPRYCCTAKKVLASSVKTKAGGSVKSDLPNKVLLLQRFDRLGRDPPVTDKPNATNTPLASELGYRSQSLQRGFRDGCGLSLHHADPFSRNVHVGAGLNAFKVVSVPCGASGC